MSSRILPGRLSSSGYISMTVSFRLMKYQRIYAYEMEEGKKNGRDLQYEYGLLQGCDGSILLDDTIDLQGEKKASTNGLNSLKSFRIIDKIKNKLESECPGIVSCADLLTIAARYVVILVGGPYWDDQWDERTRKQLILISLAKTFLLQMRVFSVSYLNSFIRSLGDGRGAHTIGMARCENFRPRIYGDFGATSGMNPLSDSYLGKLKSVCPAISGSGDNNVTSMDNVTPDLFDNSFYHTLLRGGGLFNSDQELYSSVFGIETRKLVHKYVEDRRFLQPVLGFDGTIAVIVGITEGAAIVISRVLSRPRTAI
ncbi:Peroxidase 11 [Hibiscus syriacus]|uniref:Peroxidase n=1 Tax=Hibiscus syriacus TaxID=106335 RepID=A0A6A3BXU5_HIBSY|nr:Peroxidase 11 [Hibiscus syriacus]